MNTKEFIKINMLINSIQLKMNTIDNYCLFYLLYDWVITIKESSDIQTSNFIDNNIRYIKYININDYSIMNTNTENTANIINFDLLANVNDITFISFLTRVANVMWDLIAFKSNILCKSCKGDYLRILTTIDKSAILLGCDMCGNAYDINNNLIILKDRNLIPAPNNIQELYEKIKIISN